MTAMTNNQMLHCIFGDEVFDLPQMAEMIEAGTRDSVNLLFHGQLTIEKHIEVVDNIRGLQNDIINSDSPISN